MINLLKSEKGSSGTFLVLFVRVLFALVIILAVIEICGLIIHTQNVKYIARELTRVVEQDGYINYSDLNRRLTDFNDQLNCEAKIDRIDAHTFTSTTDRQQNCIAYRDDFTLVLTDKHPLNFTNDICYNLKITAEQNGKSEVFWK